MAELVMRYQQYEEYKDSGVELLGEIPNHWDKQRLKFIFSIEKRIAGKLGFSVLSVTQKGIKVKDTESGDGQLSMDYSKYQRVHVGDFAMNHMDLLTGYIDISKFDGVTSPDYRVFRIKDHKSHDDKYYLYLLQMGYKQKTFFHLGQGSSHLGRWRLPTDAFYGIEYPVPSKVEQTQIANFLDFETAQIDTLIEKQQTLIQLLKEKRQAVISHAVTKGLNPDAPMKDSGVEWLGEVPEHWTIPQIGYHSKVTKLTGFEYTNLWRPNMEGNIIALRGFNIQERYLDLSKTERITEELSNKLARSKLYEGDIVLPCTGTLGNAALIQENDLYHINQNIAKVTINSELFNTGFTVFWMTSLPFRQMIDFNNTSGMQPVLLIGDIRKLPIPLLPLDEQQEIVDFLLLKTEQFDRLIDNAEQAIQLMQERRTALISAAVTGKIDVRGWKTY